MFSFPMPKEHLSNHAAYFLSLYCGPKNQTAEEIDKNYKNIKKTLSEELKKINTKSYEYNHLLRADQFGSDRGYIDNGIDQVVRNTAAVTHKKTVKKKPTSMKTTTVASASSVSSVSTPTPEHINEYNKLFDKSEINMFRLNKKTKTSSNSFNITRLPRESSPKNDAKNLVHETVVILSDCVRFNKHKNHTIKEIERAEMTLLYLLTGYDVKKIQKITWSETLELLKEFKYEQNTSEIVKKYFPKLTMIQLLKKTRKLKRSMYVDGLKSKKLDKSNNTIENQSNNLNKKTKDNGYYSKNFKPMFVNNVICNTDKLKYFSIESL